MTKSYKKMTKMFKKKDFFIILIFTCFFINFTLLFNLFILFNTNITILNL